MFGQIIGLPGEGVKIANNTFIVEGRPLDNTRFPVPNWLRGGGIEAIYVPDGSYFVSNVYYVTIHGRVNLDAGLVGQACLMRSYQIEATAVMRWFPLARRGLLRTGE